MHLHILGICGTFMGSLARLAMEAGHTVTGSDQNCYPPMSGQLIEMGIDLHQGWDTSPLKEQPDCVIVGNALSRGNEFVEALLDSTQSFTSGPQWLHDNILQDKWVIAVAGTHGKTTTASMVTWILESTGYNPSFLIGGVMENFGVSSRLTNSAFFVIEADEYDTAFFDKRSKFIHYKARTCILNNLEFDHADIFEDLKAIETQFHHLVRTIPNNGLMIVPHNSRPLKRVLKRGCWSPVETFLESTDLQSEDNQPDWQIRKIKRDGSQCEVYFKGDYIGVLNWGLIGDHNVSNALAALVAVKHVGVKPIDALQALSSFKNVKRRMELRGVVNQISVYDDFAHHPTAIELTINGLHEKLKEDCIQPSRVISIIDLRSNTMKMGVHKNNLINAVKKSELTFFHMPENYDWKMDVSEFENISIEHSTDDILAKLEACIKQGDHILIMSNGSFDNIHARLLLLLQSQKN